MLTTGGVWWYNGSGLHQYGPTDADDFRLNLPGRHEPMHILATVGGDPARNRPPAGLLPQYVKIEGYALRIMKRRTKPWALNMVSERA